MPLLPNGEFCQALFLLHGIKELFKAVFQEGPVFLGDVNQPQFPGKLCHRAAHVDNAADHADTGTVAQDRWQCLGITAADNGLAAAHELKGK